MPPLSRVEQRAVAAVACAALLAGCTTEPSINRRPNGGATTATVVNGVQQIVVKASDTYRFDPSRITVHPGQVRIVLVNTGKGAPHNWTLTGLPGAATALAAAGRTQTATFTAPAPGSYSIVCTIHERQGQTGKLVVLPG